MGRPMLARCPWCLQPLTTSDAVECADGYKRHAHCVEQIERIDNADQLFHQMQDGAR